MAYLCGFSYSAEPLRIPRLAFLNRESEVRILPGALLKVLQIVGLLKRSGEASERFHTSPPPTPHYPSAASIAWALARPDLGRSAGGSEWRMVNKTWTRLPRNVLLVTVVVTFGRQCYCGVVP